MLQKWLSKHLPKRKTIEKNNSNLPFVKRLFQHDIWHFTWYSTAMGVAIGLFTACIPLPIQTLLAILLCILLRGNVILAICFTWVSNPITFAFFIYAIYWTGTWFTGENISEFSIPNNMDNLSWAASKEWLQEAGASFLVGLPMFAFALAITGFLIVAGLWQLIVLIKKN